MNSIEAPTESNLENYKSKGLEWRAILLLQFQPQFQIAILLSIFVAYHCCMIDFANTYGCNTTEKKDYNATFLGIIFCCDIMLALDILLMMAFRNVQWDEVEHLYEKRSSVAIGIDIFSIIPWDAFYASLDDVRMQTVYVLRLRYALRLYRLLYYTNKLRNDMETPTFVILLCYASSYTILLTTIACTFYTVLCRSYTCTMANPLHVMFFYMNGLLLFGGHLLNLKFNVWCKLCLISISLCSFLYFMGTFVSRMILVKIKKYQKREVFRSLERFALNSCKNLDKDVERTCKAYFPLLWRRRHGIIFDNAHIKIIPKGIANEINLDISWDLLKHSRLFREEEIENLHVISPYIKQKLLAPGEFIFKRKQLKSQIVYIVSGVVQILSEQDGETPILSLSSGTCIGESTLLVDYPSTYTVICQSACEVSILTRNDFLKVYAKYPAMYKMFHQRIKQRYLEAREYYSAMLTLVKGTVEDREALIFKWVKATLQELFHCKNTLKENFSSMSCGKQCVVFCTEYLDLLSVIEKTQIVTDTVFLKDTCPCILQSDSFIVSVWNVIIEVVAFLFLIIYPYYASFETITSTWYFVFSYITLLLWMLDIYVACSTSIKDQNQFVTTIEEIALVRIQNPVFFIDLIATIPLELVIYAVDSNVQPQKIVLLQMLRLLKCYKVENLFYYSKLSIVEQTYLKFAVYLVLLIYYIAAFLHLNLCEDEICNFAELFENSSNSPFSTILLYTSVVTIEITNKGPSIFYYGNETKYYLLFIQIMPFLFYTYFVSSVVAMQVLNRLYELKGRIFVTDLVTMIKRLNMKPQLSDLLIRHIQNQLDLNRAINYRSSQQRLKQIYHPLIMQNVNTEKFGFVLESVPLFSNLPKNLVPEIAEKAYTLIMGPGEIVTCTGETCKEIFIIIKGYCQVTSSLENSKIILTANSVLSAFEMFVGIPVVRTVITITHCKFIVLSSQDLTEVLISYPHILSEFQTTAHLISENIFTDLAKDNDENLLQLLNAEKPSSFKSFRFKSNEDTLESINFHKIFDELKFLGFTRYLLLRHTIKSDGMFLKYWEIFRCIFAFATAMLTPFIPISTCHRCSWYFFLLFLDITAWVDICIKHHVCYFNRQNIEITHPLKTVIHYWKSSFLVDFIGVFPWHFIMIPLFKMENNVNNIVYFKMIKLLQTYRIFRGIAYLNKNLTSSENWVSLKYIPVTLLLLNTIGTLIVNSRCTFDASTNSFESGIECSTTWLTKFPLEKPSSMLRVYLYGIFYVTIVMAGPAKEGLLLNKEDIHQTAVLSILGYLYFVYITANIVSSHIFRHSDSTLHQQTMSNLITFLSCKRLDPVLKQEVVEHFKYVFNIRQRKNVRNLIKQISTPLEAQFLLNVFGNTLKNSGVFDNVPNSFLSNLLLHMNFEPILHRGIICKVNDIHNKIYFIVDGQVDVLGADYNHLIYLGTGSLFGNLGNIGLARQKLTIIAKGHVKLLSISNRNFYNLIKHNVHFRAKYHNLILFNTDYILEEASHSVEESFSLRDSMISLQKSMVWEVFIIGIVCYLGFLVELYLITMQDHTIIEILFVYLCDVCFIINIYLNFILLYKDEYGIVISDKRKIAKRYMKKRLGFYFAVMCVLPIEVLSLLFRKQGMALTVWNYCRANRLLKICTIMHYLKKTASQISTNSIISLVLLGVWISLVTQILASTLIAFSCITPESNLNELLACNWTNASSTTKLYIYVTNYASILCIFTGTALLKLPNSSELILFFIIIIIGLRLFAIVILKHVAAVTQLFVYDKLKYEKTAYELKEYMSWRQTSVPLINKVRLYIKFLWKSKRGQQYPMLLEEAPYYLCEGVFNSLYGYLLRKHYKFSLCHVDLIRQISSKMRPVTFLYGNYVVFKNDLNETMYFVHEGGVDAINEESTYTENIAKTINPGEVFGYEAGLYPNLPHVFTYRANKLTVLIILQRSDWIYLLDFFPASKEIMLNQ